MIPAPPPLRRRVGAALRRAISVPTDRPVLVADARGGGKRSRLGAGPLDHETAAPIFAPLAAMLTVQATVLKSVRTGLQRTAGVATGVVLAFVLSSALGSLWSVGILVFVGLAGRASRSISASQGSTQIAVSALLVLVLSTGSNSYAIARVLDTLIGAAVGILVSLLVVPRCMCVTAETPSVTSPRPGRPTHDHRRGRA